MSATTAKQLIDGNGALLKSQYYDPVTDKYLPGSASSSATQPSAPSASGTLAGTSIAQPMAGAPLPFTATLVSSAGTREIALSTDGGINYFVPTRQDGSPAYDANTTTLINIVVTGKVTHVRFTGIAGNTWSIL